MPLSEWINDHNDVGSRLLWNISRPKSLPDYMASDPRRRLSSQSLPRGPPRVTFATLSADELFSVSSPKRGNDVIKVPSSKLYSVFTSDIAFVQARKLSPYSNQVSGWTTDKSWFDFRQGKNISLPPQPKASRQAVGPNQPPIQFVFGFLPQVGGGSGRGVKLNNRLDLAPKLRMSRVIPPRPHISSWRAQGQGVLVVNVRQVRTRKKDNERRSEAMLYFVWTSKKFVPPVATQMSSPFETTTFIARPLPFINALLHIKI
jgi:hypothetical protein